MVKKTFARNVQPPPGSKGLTHITEKNIFNLLSSNLKIHYLDIIDETNRHQNHKKDTPGGHYKIILISNDFIDLDLISRHKQIYEILNTMMKTDIHAISMKLMTVDEFKSS